MKESSKNLNRRVAERSSESRQRWIEANKPKMDLGRTLRELRSPHLRRERERQEIAVRYVEKSLLCTPSRESSWEDYVGLAAAAEVQNAYRLLIEEVRAGDANALRALAELSCNAVQELNAAITGEAAGASWKALVPFARKQAAWPMLIGRRKSVGDSQDRRDELIRLLEVGRENLLGWGSAARFRPSRPKATVLLKMILEIESLRSRAKYLVATFKEGDWRKVAVSLAPLTKDTGPQWLECIHDWVDEILKSEPDGEALRAAMGCKIPRGKTLRATLRKRLDDELGSLLGDCRKPKG